MLRPRFIGLSWFILSSCNFGFNTQMQDKPAVLKETTVQTEKPNLIVFLTDTVRARQFGAYGYEYDTSPVFDTFAREHVLFTQAYAPTSWTRPSVASLFTGLYPQRHGVEMRQDTLAPDHPTLAAALKKEGWSTYMLNTNPHITESWKMTRGFEQAVHVMPHPDQFKAGNGANVMLRRLRQLAPTFKEPFFLYVHLIDPHYPYAPPQNEMNALGYGPDNNTSRDRYDGEIHYVDRHIGKMMEVLEGHGFTDNAAVIMTSDHGDEFGEHGGSGHGKTLYQEVVHVPLAMGFTGSLQDTLFRSSKRRCRKLSRNVSLVDLMPTVFDVFNLAAPPNIDGMSLLPQMRCHDPGPERPIYFSIEKERTSEGGVLVDSAKLLVNRSSGLARLFLLDDDPLEMEGQIDTPERQKAYEHLRKRLTEFEWGIRSGIYLELAGLDGREHSTQWHLRLTTEGKITKVDAFGIEKEDGYHLSDDQQVLTISTTLRSVWHRSPKHVWVQDRDNFNLVIEPPDASVTLLADQDDHFADLAKIRLPLNAGMAWPMSFESEHLWSQDRLVDRRPEGLYLYASRPSEVEAVATIPDSLNEALKVLGYIH
jgi:arylsulfatase A-like enzyme